MPMFGGTFDGMFGARALPNCILGAAPGTVGKASHEVFDGTCDGSVAGCVRHGLLVAELCVPLLVAITNMP